MKKSQQVISGVIEMHKGGFAFLLPDDKNYSDVYLRRSDLLDAMDGDQVEIALLPHRKGKRLEGRVIKVIHRACTQVVGILQKNKGFGFVVPDNSHINYDVYVPGSKLLGAKNNQKVVAKITKWPTKGFNMEGEIIEVLGYPDEQGVDIVSLIREHDLPEDFPAEVWQEARAFDQCIKAENFPNRLDLRSKTIITIDGEDAKDLDDGVSLERAENGNYILGVHIADVGYYVKEGSPLDKEAYKRGTSVYLADRVIPMLPPELSNGICSLNAGEDRLAMSVFLEFDKKGSLLKSEIADTVICVYRRMNYTDVRNLLEGDDRELLKKHKDILPLLKDMAKLAKLLQKKRFARGSIDFDFPELKVILDEKGVPVELKPRVRSIAEQLIEEFMLAANQAVAETMFWQEVPFLYRVHEVPTEEKIFALKEFLFGLGYRPRGLEKGHPEAYQRVLAKVKGKPEERIVSTIVLRCMQRARYCEASLGHFGLAAKYYSHFTSPIRRYPDLVIHRLIREYRMNGLPSEERREFLETVMPKIAVQSSSRERVAEEAERDTLELKKAEFMQKEIGSHFKGIISGVQSFGLFVELDNLVEGLVHISNLTDDYYQHDAEHYCLLGQRTGRRYRIGDPVTVEVIDVDMQERKIDLLLVD